MNKNNYVWTFNAAALGAGIDSAFSLEYHIPASKLKVDPAQLAGSRVWLVIKDGGEHFLYAMITPAIIESYQEGRYKDDFLISAAPFFSVRFLPRHESRKPWKLTTTLGDDEIRECTSDEQGILQDLVDQNHRVGFAPPARSIFDSIPQTVFSDLEHAVPDQLKLTLRTVAFGDIARVRSYPDSISAFSTVALTLLKKNCPQLVETEIIALISALDPMTKKVDKSQFLQEKVMKTLSSLPPIVDTFLEEIDPDKISPRTFIASMPHYSSEWIEKTNDAEQAHEKILKDLVLRLRSRGYKVYKSRSFDVFAEKSGTRLLWEIKSANGFNSVAQGEKGILQLLRYSTALIDDGWKDVKVLLLLQDSNQPGVQQYLSKMGKRAGVELCLYNDGKDWPERVSFVELETVLDL